MPGRGMLSLDWNPPGGRQPSGGPAAKCPRQAEEARAGARASSSLRITIERVSTCTVYRNSVAHACVILRTLYRNPNANV
jgi:hypothetical protein